MKNYKYFTLNDYESYVLLLSNEDIYFLYDQIKKEIKTKTAEKLIYTNGLFLTNQYPITNTIIL